MKATTAKLTLITVLAAVFIMCTLPTHATEKDVKVVAVEGKERAAGEHIAILVGVEEYQNPIESLKYTVDDTKLLAEALTKYGVYDRVITIADDAEIKPEKSDILRKLAVETGNASSNDSILFYFSGHGISIEGKDYLIPADAFMTGNNMAMLASTALSVDEISAILKESPAKSQLIIIDACRNMGGKAMGDAPGFEDIEGSQDSIRIVSAKTGQRSYEWEDQGHGVFTYFFVKGLHGEADGYASNEQDGVVTAIEAFNYTREQMKDWGRDNDSIQTPQLLSESNDEMALSILDLSARRTDDLGVPAVIAPDIPATPSCPAGMVYIPPGSFMMGSSQQEITELYEICKNIDPNCELSWFQNEGPQKRVTLTKGFCMDRTEVTQGDYERVMGNNPSGFKNCGSNCPVETVSWYDAKAYCEKVGKRLPTEAEWEYAARAGDTSWVYGGVSQSIVGLNNAPGLDTIAWYGGNSGVSYEDGWDCSGWSGKQYSSKTCGAHPVAKKKPNAFGLYDTLGNVWEWVEDCYEKDWYERMSTTNPLNTSTNCVFRVLRGGSGYINLWDSRVSARGFYHASSALSVEGHGFRCAADPN